MIFVFRRTHSWQRYPDRYSAKTILQSFLLDRFVHTENVKYAKLLTNRTVLNEVDL